MGAEAEAVMIDVLPLDVVEVDASAVPQLGLLLRLPPLIVAESKALVHFLYVYV